MTQLSNDLVKVLRRRAKTLHDDGYAPEWCASLMRAADELWVHRQAAGEPERTAVQAFAEVRRLRTIMVQVFNQVRAQKPAGWPHEVLDKLKGGLNAVPELGKGRRIISIQVGDDDSRAKIEQLVADLLDAHYNKGADNGESNDNGEVRPEPGGEGGSDQPGSPSTADAGGHAEEGASRQGAPAESSSTRRDTDQHPSHAQGNGGAPGEDVQTRADGPHDGEGDRRPLENMAAPLGNCTGPFTDARDCPVHRPFGPGEISVQPPAGSFVIIPEPGVLAAERFHAHLDVCPQCEGNPFTPCAVGAELLKGVVGLPIKDIAEQAVSAALNTRRCPRCANMGGMATAECPTCRGRGVVPATTAMSENARTFTRCEICATDFYGPDHQVRARIHVRDEHQGQSAQA